LFDFDRFKKLLQTENQLNLVLCQSLYGFNPLTINPDREPIFKKAPFFYEYFYPCFEKNQKTGLKTGTFCFDFCQFLKNRLEKFFLADFQKILILRLKTENPS